MVSDGLSILNADYSASTFRMSHVEVGAHNFIGNNIAFPAGARVGENVLLGTKVMVPMDGQVRENVGLLGSPCFEIPRTVARDTEFDHLKEPGVLRRRLWRKNRHNTVSMALFLAVRWLQVFVSTLAARRRGRPVLPVRDAEHRRRRRWPCCCSTSCSASWSSGWCWASGR